VDPLNREAHARVTAPVGARHNSVKNKEMTIVPKDNPIENRDTDVGAGDVPDTAAVAGGNGAASALLPGAPDTPAVGALWPALGLHAGGTTAELAEAARISRSAAAKALAALEEAGLVSRAKGGRQGARLLPDRWHPNPVIEPAVFDNPAEGLTVQAASVPGGGEAPETAVRVKTESARLRPGALREMVVAYLREHSDEDLSPSALGRALARSSGAVANACDRLVADGVITQASDRPRRYRWARGGR
jgi:biotin operon repressor